MSLVTKAFENTMPEFFQEYKGQKGFFVKSFFATDNFNQNGWKIDLSKLFSIMQTALEKRFPNDTTAPIILRDDMSHPDSKLSEKQIHAEQEKDRIGNIIDVGMNGNRSFVIAQITTQKGIDFFNKNPIVFVSPSFNATDYISNNGKMIVTDARVNHLAIVDDPAYGTTAQVVGTCMDTKENCLRRLDTIQASVMEKCNKTGNNIISIAGEKFELSADDCVSKWIEILENEDSGRSQEQNIAIAFAKCKRGDKPLANAAMDEKIDPNNPKDVDRPDSEFAYVPKDKPKSDRKLPIFDKEHTQNALARFSKTDIPQDEKKKVLEKICTRAKKFGIDSELCNSKLHAKSLKAIHNNNKHMSPEEIDKMTEEEAKAELKKMSQAQDEDDNNPKTETKEDNKNADTEVEDLKKQLASIKATLDEEIKKPMAEKISNARAELGLIAKTDVENNIKNYMTESVSKLKTLNADYEKLSTVQQKEQLTFPSMGQLQASSNENIEMVKNIRNKIRSRFQ